MFVLSLQKLCLDLKPHNDLRFHILQDKKGVRHQANKNVNLLNTTGLTIQTQPITLFKKSHTEHSKS